MSNIIMDGTKSKGSRVGINSRNPNQGATVGREYPASGYYKFKTDAANIAAQRQQQQLQQN